LPKGDKIINTRIHNQNGDFVSSIQITINKGDTIRTFKTKIREKVGVSEDRQIISEWYSEHFYKLFPDENVTIQAAKIRKTDILRMDEVSDVSLVTL
jgi:hypothetical protein